MPAKDIIIDFFVRYGIRILGALVILALGIGLARWAALLTTRGVNRLEMEPPVRILIVRLVRLIVIALTLVIALDKFGVQVAPLIAGIGIAGVGVGLAMQGVLGNLVAGLTIILTKPFRIGEYIAIHGVEGQVALIELFSTTLTHPDLSRVIVPNRKMVGEILHNYGQVRQLALKLPISYRTDISRIIDLVRKLVVANPRVLKNPPPMIGISLLDESALVLGIQPWTKVEDYVVAQAELYQAILAQLQTSAIEMPVPQRQIRVMSDSPAKQEASPS